MTGKVLEGNPAGLLVLILPLGVGLVLLYKAWLYILIIVGLVLGWKVWENYQWQQWSLQVNPIFNQLIQENQGCLTPVDLSLKGNLTANAARKFLERKADEFGAYRRSYQDKGTVYYFITASTLGKIFDESELTEDEPAPTLPPAVNSPVLSAPTPPVLTEPEKPSASPFAQLAEIKEERQSTPEAESMAPVALTETLETPVTEFVAPEPQINSVATESVTPQSESNGLTLIQADLAKRLDTTSSTIARRKAEPDFTEWSLSKDPEGVAWSYDPDTKLFMAIES
ncbi:MAG: hypothetical protein VKJ02_17945 [Snowella sp.]|nr:hypothetical protein [Snowella sp.]